MNTQAKATIKLAVPIVIGELAQMSLHIVDTAMIGALGYKQLAAAALVVSTVNIPFVLGIGITISVSQMVSMANGRGDKGMVSHYFYNGFVLCAAAAVIISLALVFGRNVVHHLGQDAEVATLAAPFLSIISISIIPMLLFMTLKQFADGLELTRTAMLFSLAAIPLNAFLNWLMIYGNWGFPRMELAGAGWATFITRSIIFVALAIVILRHKAFREYIADRSRQWHLKWATWRELLYIGIPSSLQIGIEVSAFAVSAIIMGTISAVAQAAHQIAISCASFTFMVSMGLSQAGSIRVSNAFGRREWPLIAAIGKATLSTAFIYGLICALGFVLLRHQLPLLFNKETAVLELSALLLLFAAIFQISDSTQAVGAGLLRGIKDVKTPTLLIAVAYWVVAIPAGLFFGFQMGYGAAGIWAGLILGLTFASGFLIRRFLISVRRHQV